MTDAAPPVLNDRYELRDLLGQGGMAEVYRGHDRVLGREVAVKVMHAALSADVDRQRFASEARLLASLNDPHLVTLLDAGVDDADGSPRPWLVMELVTGPTLARHLAAGPLPADDVATIGAGLATALGHVHARGIVHRDLKPANVLITASGSAKLADFGVARLTDEQSDLTATGHTIGTAAYLAPEQVSGRPITGASDVYALGLVLLEALTGQREYAGTPIEAALARLHRTPLIPVSLGAGWVRLLDAMTATDPADRPSADEAAAQLAALSAGAAPAEAGLAPIGLDSTGAMAVPVAAIDESAATAVRPVVGRDRRRRSRSAVLSGAAAVVAALLVLGIAWMSAGGTDTEPSSAEAAAPTSTAAKPTKDKTRRQPSPSTAPTPAETTTPVTLTSPTKKVDKPKQKRDKQKGPEKTKAKKSTKSKGQKMRDQKPGKDRAKGKRKGKGNGRR